MGSGLYLKFPFQYSAVEGLGRLFYPVVEVELMTVVGWRRFEFLVDTGADVTTISSSLLPILGLKKEKLKMGISYGVGGIMVEIWDLVLPIRMDKSELKVKCCAVDTREGKDMLLLGRKDIFEEKFNLILDSRRKVVELREN